jgi:tetratricopeptide (TPR) repeat protein
MPITINGIGTQYYFKRNVVTHQGVCEHCHRVATLSDYDIGLFFVVIHIPLIPLGRQMIIHECNACHMHRTMPLKQWEQIREQAITSGLDELSQAPHSSSAALALLGTYTAFNQLTDARDLAGAIRATHATDYDTMLALGSWYESRQHESEANECFQVAVRLDPERIPSKRIRLFDAIEGKKINEVQQLSDALLTDRQGDHQSVLVLAAKFFVQQQKFDFAYALFKKLIDNFPELKKDKEFRRIAREAEQGVGLPTTLVPAKKLGMLD